MLYKLRNKVAHNRHVKKDEFERIVGISSQIKEVIAKATAKLGEIDINEEDRELIIYSYNSDSPAAIGFLSEKAVAEYYMKSGFEVASIESPHLRMFDFFVSKDNQKIAVEVKSIRPQHFVPMMRMTVERQLMRALQSPDIDEIAKIHLVCVLRDDDIEYPTSRIMSYAMKMSEQFGGKLEIHLGRLNEENTYIPLERLFEADQDRFSIFKSKLALAQEYGIDFVNSPRELFSNRESQVLRLLGSGKKVSEIAQTLSVSVKTVSTYRAHILEKLKLKNNAEIASYVAGNGLKES